MDSLKYWDKRYSSGGNSGNGSYGDLLQFKAKIINDRIKKWNIKTIQDFGCGDGSLFDQLYLNAIEYTGYDVSDFLISNLKNTENDLIHFKNYNEYNAKKSDLVLSIDVIFHLVEDNVYRKYIEDIQAATGKYLIVYSSNRSDLGEFGNHIKHREYTKDIQMDFEEFIPNAYPYSVLGEKGSFCDFCIFKKCNSYLS